MNAFVWFDLNAAIVGRSIYISVVSPGSDYFTVLDFESPGHLIR